MKNLNVSAYHPVVPLVRPDDDLVRPVELVRAVTADAAGTAPAAAALPHDDRPPKRAIAPNKADAKSEKRPQAQAAAPAAADQAGARKAKQPADRRVAGNPRSAVRSWRTAFERRELRYGDPVFTAASELARSLPDPPQLPDLLVRVVRHPSLLRTLLAVARLPQVELRPQRADTDAWAGTYFNPPQSSRLGQAVLELPTAEKQYLSGRPKQALRTNLSHARKNGITSIRVPTYEEWMEDVAVVLKARGDLEPAEWEHHLPEPGQRVAYYVARDADQAPLACARVALYGELGVLFSMLSRTDRYPDASWARYQMHTFLALDLGRSGHKYLQVGSAFKEPDGTQFFQHLVGYRARSLKVSVAA